MPASSGSYSRPFRTRYPLARFLDVGLDAPLLAIATRVALNSWNSRPGRSYWPLASRVDSSSKATPHVLGGSTPQVRTTNGVQLTLRHSTARKPMV